MGVVLPILYDKTFLEEAVSVLDLSVLVLAVKFRLKSRSDNSLFHHLLEHDFLDQFSRIVAATK